MNSVALQLAKLIIGALVALGCLAVIAFQKKLGLDLDVETMTALVGVVVLSGGASVHGAYKTPAPPPS